MLHQDKSLYIAIAIPLYKGIFCFLLLFISVSFFWLGDYKILPTLQKLCILPGTRYC